MMIDLCMNYGVCRDRDIIKNRLERQNEDEFESILSVEDDELRPSSPCLIDILNFNSLDSIIHLQILSIIIFISFIDNYNHIYQSTICIHSLHEQWMDLEERFTKRKINLTRDFV